MCLRVKVERGRGKLCNGIKIIEADERPLATVLELCDEAWSYSILSEHPEFSLAGSEIGARFKIILA